YWWLLLLRGVLAILFGISAFIWPGLTLATLVMLFAAYSLVDGIFTVVHAIGYRAEIEHWGLLLIEGLFGIAFGVLAFRSPELTTLIGGVIVAMYLAAWAIVTGAMRIAMAVRLRKEIEGEWLLGLSGLLSILFGIVIMARPATGALAVIYFVALWAIVLGITLIALAFKARKAGNKLTELKARIANR
ncbi:MAG: HdeD family acid-resistance protein, partial [Planctomycetaceae bacterium]